MSKSSQLRQRAQSFLKKGNLPKAIEEYRRLLSVESKNPNLYNELGDIHLKANDRQQAVSCFEKAVTNYEKVALYNNAVAVCKKILRIVPNRVETIFKLGELKAKQKFAGEAVNYFSQFMDLTFSGSEVIGGDIQGKIDRMVELVPDNEEVHSKAADAYSRIGMKLKAAELLSALIVSAGERGDSERMKFYQVRIESLRSAMTRDELDEVDRLIERHPAGEESGTPAGEPDTSTGDIVTAGGPAETYGDDAIPDEDGDLAAGAADVQHAPEGSPDAQPEGSAPMHEGPEAGPAAEVKQEGDVPEEAAESPAEEFDESEMIAAMDINESPPVAEQQVQQPEPEEALDKTQVIPPAGKRVSVEADSGTAPDTQVAGGGDSPETEAEAVGVEQADASTDFSSMIEEGEDADEVAELTQEITSDIEANDHKSHYDLGMAYLEMALYTEAVKEYQIAARSEQLQLKSMEMIGYCFLQMNKPRLAVKQLVRGLEIAKSVGGDKLGLHYNLGMAYDMLNEPDKAREHYEEVYIVDVTFRDVAEKMKRYSTIP
ncbi:MAG: tetratricopeptide repeat protein [bacterium]|nr:MAG: tetratricopeptide repeat protein [bacterium]